MRVAVISDVHANLYALETVLGELEEEPPDEIWCLGDTVGYGPRPNECCSIVAERCARILVGNHDLVALGSSEVGVDEFNPDAAAASHWTAAELTEDSRGFLARLEPRAELEGVELFHGSPRDPIWDYVLTDDSIADSFALTSAPLVLVGHSHIATALRHESGSVQGRVAPAGFQAELRGARWLLNPGSVGQPRDGDPRAAYLRLDLTAGSARFERVAYPLERTQAEIRERGLPDSLAERLAYGV